MPGPAGLYHPDQEHDACGVGFICNLNGVKSHDIIHKALEILVNLTHRGACGCDEKTGDGAGILIQMPARLPPSGRGGRGDRPAGRCTSTAAGWCSCRATPASAPAACTSSKTW